MESPLDDIFGNIVSTLGDVNGHSANRQRHIQQAQEDKLETVTSRLTRRKAPNKDYVAQGRFKIKVFAQPYMKGADDRRIWRASIQGGAETLVLGPILRRDYNVANDGIYFIPGPDSSRNNSIRFLSFATGEITTIASIGNAWSNYISVSPDSRWILYPKLDQEGSGLVLVENFR
ncbi:MAG: hypothetical protein EXQ58_07850 [Acidobacteria bacterium]|nr:hypothetical protein [Acidobacteriota bacterium]